MVLLALTTFSSSDKNNFTDSMIESLIFLLLDSLDLRLDNTLIRSFLLDVN